MDKRGITLLAIIGTALAAIPLWVTNIVGWLAYVFTFGLWAGLVAIIAAVIMAILGRRQISGPLPWSGVGALVVGLALVATGLGTAWTSGTGACPVGGTCFNPAIQQAQALLRAAALAFVAGAILLGLDLRQGVRPAAATEPLK